MVEVLARAVFIATTLWHFNIPATNQAAAVCSQTTLKCSVAEPPAQKRVCTGRSAQKARILKWHGFFPATAENQKAYSHLFIHTM